MHAQFGVVSNVFISKALHNTQERRAFSTIGDGISVFYCLRKNSHGKQEHTPSEKTEFCDCTSLGGFTCDVSIQCHPRLRSCWTAVLAEQ
jgi:hypothetical protein